MVVVFTAVFVAAGAIVLGPQQQIPNEENLLSLQAAFVTSIHPWLMPLYCAGAFLAMIGTLYGTLEVAGSLAVEMAACLRQDLAARHAQRIKRIAVIWWPRRCVDDPVVVMPLPIDRRRGEATSVVGHSHPGQRADGSAGLRAIVRTESMDGSTVSSATLRFPWWLWFANLAAMCVLVAVGLHGCWNGASRWYALGGLGILLAISLIGAICGDTEPRESPELSKTIAEPGWT